MNRQFSGKVALITGGNSGIGRATAIAFAREGAKVIISARREKESEETLDLIKQAGGEGTFIQADLINASDIENMVNKTLITYGRLDFAFNNAGISGTAFGTTTDFSEEDWDRVMNINVKAVWLCMKYEIPHILKQGGAIVNMASIAGIRAVRLSSLYTASKHAVVGLTKHIALEYASRGLRVNAVCPGPIHTPMFEQVFGENIQKTINRIPLGRLGTVDEVANAVIWLCSDASSFITGVALPIDGGVSA